MTDEEKINPEEEQMPVPQETAGPEEMPGAADASEPAEREPEPETAELSAPENAAEAEAAENAVPDAEALSDPENAPENAPEAAEEAGAAVVAGEPQQPPEAWTFSGQLEKEKKERKKKRGRGALVYAIVMTVLFLVCFGILAALLLSGNQTVPGGGSGSGKTIIERTIFVREYEDGSGLLTVPEVVDLLTPSTVGIQASVVNAQGQAGTSTGTGVIYRAEGYIITNYHVIENSTDVTVVLYDRTRVSAVVVGGDERSDIAVLKISAAGLVPAAFGDSNALVAGEQVVALGNPEGLDYFGTVTVGHVSAVNRDVKIYDASGYLEKRMKMVQTDTSLNPGNSGGPLVDLHGHVIGINTMKLTDTEGMGFAIQSNGAVTVADSIIRTGAYSGEAVAYYGVSLGISCAGVKKGDVLTDFNPPFRASETGVVVLTVTEGKSAAGILLPGDIVTMVDGFRVSTADELREHLFDHCLGETVRLTVVRGDRTLEAEILLK